MVNMIVHLRQLIDHMMVMREVLRHAIQRILMQHSVTLRTLLKITILTIVHQQLRIYRIKWVLIYVMLKQLVKIMMHRLHVFRVSVKHRLTWHRKVRKSQQTLSNNSQRMLKIVLVLRREINYFLIQVMLVAFKHCKI